MRKAGSFIVAIVFTGLLLSGSGCATGRITASRGAGIHHVVVCWLKTPGDAAARAKLIETSRSFASLPGVISVNAGQVVPGTRSVVDSTFDVAIVISLRDKQALSEYQESSVHKNAVESVMKPLVGRMVIYDFAD